MMEAEYLHAEGERIRAEMEEKVNEITCQPTQREQRPVQQRVEHEIEEHEEDETTEQNLVDETVVVQQNEVEEHMSNNQSFDKETRGQVQQQQVEMDECLNGCSIAERNGEEEEEAIEQVDEEDLDDRPIAELDFGEEEEEETIDEQQGVEVDEEDSNGWTMRFSEEEELVIDDEQQQVNEEDWDDQLIAELDFGEEVNEQQPKHVNEGDSSELGYGEQEEEEEATDEQQQVEVDEEKRDLREQVKRLIEENKLLKQQVKLASFGIQTIEANDKLTKFYTGLPTWPVFLHLFLFLNVSTTSPLSRLSPENELLLVLVRLRLGLLYKDLAVRFNVCLSAVTRIVNKWINLMYTRLSFLIAWPEQDVCRLNLPTAFKETYPQCRCIIDCSEIFIETPANFTARAQTYSNYKKHNTIKRCLGQG